MYHILPICGYNNSSDWDGFQIFNPTINKGSAMIWKGINCTNTSRNIKFKGLVGTTNYAITFQDRTSQNCTMTGATLMDTGITVAGMTGTYASEAIWIS